jgi:hypothetical protein
MNHPSNSSLFEVYLPDGLAENISTIGPSANSIRVPQPLIPLRSPFSEEYRPALQRRPARCTSGFILCFCFPLTPMVDNSRDRQPAGGETPPPIFYFCILITFLVAHSGYPFARTTDPWSFISTRKPNKYGVLIRVMIPIPG